MKVLVTGAAGFIGAAIVEQLDAVGHQVVGIDALIPEAHAPGTKLPEGTHLEDLRHPKGWETLLVGCDAVCHQAAMVGAGVTVADLPSYAGHNDLGTASLLAAMSRQRVGRLVLASSMVVYGEGLYTCSDHGMRRAGIRSRNDLEDGRFDHACDVCGRPLAWALVPEDAPMDPLSSYAVSKLAQEHYTRAWVRQAPAAAIALRYHNVYGPGMPRDTPYSGVAAIFRSSLERGESPRVFEDGAQMRDFVHLSDVVRANVLALEHVVAASPGLYAAYNVASGHPVSIADVARILGGGAHPEVTGQYRTGDVRHVVASPSLASEELGFTAGVTPESGIAAFASAPLRASGGRFTSRS
ncbi:MAG: NAD-dependent epimerase/dehydratase family protein [Actinomycetota bacterium]|nr:NAD-dependent epimerase/dehydratase family protein [Actinomycetota bacterium]